MTSIETEILISASPAKVWCVLTNLKAYHEWNPFIVVAHGEVHQGTRLTNTIQLQSGKQQTFKPKVLIAKVNQEFRWLGRFILPGLFDGEHYFRLEPTASGATRLVHGEVFRGVLVSLIMNSIKEQTRKGFEAMNKALKDRVESQPDG